MFGVRSLLCGLEAVAQGHDTVVHAGVLRVGSEETGAHELELIAGLCVGQSLFQLAALADDNAVGIQIILVVAALGDGVHVRLSEELVVQAYLGIHGVGGAHPVDGTLDLAAIGRVAVAGLEVGGAVDDSDAAVGVLLDALALDDIAAHQTDFAADGQALELRRRHLGEVLVLDPQLPGEGDLAGGGVVGFPVGVVGDVEILGLRINVTSLPKKVTAQVGKKKVKLTKAASKDEFAKGENVFFYDEAPDLNRFATKGSEFEKTVITKNPQLLVKLGVTDITANTTTLRIEGFRFIPEDRYRITSGTLAAPVARVTADNTEAYTLKPTWDKVANADFYEIDFMNMLYTTIKDTELLFGDLTPETPYSFKIRAVNKDGASAWTEFGAATKSDPLEFAIRGIRGECTAASQGRVGVKRLFDFVESGDIWHSKYGEKAVPFELVMDLVTVNQLDKFHYLPRTNAGNGTLLKGTVSYSMNKEQWTEAGTFEWQRDDEVKVFNFTQHPTARYIKLSVTEAVGNYGSGKEIYVFKVPGTESYLQGDINVDGKIDGNDLTSYTNYTGLRKGDSDFEGYISNGDINKNGLIDAYDISVVATQLEGGVDNRGTEKVDGTIEISTSKQVYDKDEIIEIQVKGVDLRAVNAFSFALPYNQQDYEFVGVELQHMNAMENLTYDRLHSNGSKALYPTFVNVGNKKTLEGTVDLFLLKFKAKRQVKFGLKIIDGLLVDKRLNTRRSGVQ